MLIQRSKAALATLFHTIVPVMQLRHLGRAAMKLPRRTFLHLAAGAAALPVVSRIARAQTYPARPVRLIVGFAAGALNDLVARLIRPTLSERRWPAFLHHGRP